MSISAIAAALLVQGQPVPLPAPAPLPPPPVVVPGPPPPLDPCHAAAAVPGENGCPAWQRIQGDAAGILFADPGSVADRGDAFELTLRQVNTVDDEDGIRSAMFRLRFDCRRRTSQTLRITLYTAAGRELFGGAPTGAEAAPQPAARGSVRADLLDTYCPRRT